MGNNCNFMLITDQFSKMMAFLLIFHMATENGEAARLNPWDTIIRQSTDKVDQQGTRWAVLVAGSNGYGNYRHQVIQKRKKQRLNCQN